MRRPTLPATRGLCRAQPPLVFSAHPETPTAASTISQLRHIRRAAPVGAQVPRTTWGRFAHDSPRERVEVHLPCVLESRSAGQHALAPPTDGHPPVSRQPHRQFNHFPNHPTTAFQPRANHREPKPIYNRPSTAKSTTSQQSFYRLPATTHTLIARASSHPPRQARTSSSLPRRHQAQCPDPATATIPHCSPHCPLRTVLGANGESLQWLNNRQT